jgi:hypothetical protein
MKIEMEKAVKEEGERGNISSLAPQFNKVK